MTATTADPPEKIFIHNTNELVSYLSNVSETRPAMLITDVNAPSGKAFFVPKNKNAVIYIDGHNIIGSNGVEVFTVDGGKLTIYGRKIILLDKRTIKTEGREATVEGYSKFVTGKTGMITHNGGEGRGIFVRSGELTLNDVQVVGNKKTANSYVSNDGGGIYVKSGKLKMNHVDLKYNLAKDLGGGLYVGSDATAVVINGGSVGNNVAYKNGGGIYSAGSIFDIDKCSVSLNTATKNGGGIYIAGGKVFTRDGCRIEHN